MFLLQKQQTQEEERYEAAKLLNKRFPITADIDNMKWEQAVVGRKRILATVDYYNLRAISFTISRGNPTQANQAISSLLLNNVNKKVKGTVTHHSL